jgi:hypothetical protein
MCVIGANQVKAGSAGAIEAVVAALHAHGATVGVQKAGCTAILNMCWTHDANRARARAAGAVSVLQAAIATFKVDPVGRNATAALAKVSAYDDAQEPAGLQRQAL